MSAIIPPTAFADRVAARLASGLTPTELLERLSRDPTASRLIARERAFGFPDPYILARFEELPLNLLQPAELPTQQGLAGIRYDFNFGARLYLPPGPCWHVQLRNLDKGSIIFDGDVVEPFWSVPPYFFVRLGVYVWANGSHVFTHEYAATAKPILVQIMSGALGDTLAWIPHVARFADLHQANVTCTMAAELKALLAPGYPSLRLVSHDEMLDLPRGDNYATYHVGVFGGPSAPRLSPVDFRTVSLSAAAAHILGTPPEEIAPRLILPDETRPIEEPYVCIGVQASGYRKMWSAPGGWARVVAHLRERGYRVLCIDLEASSGDDKYLTEVPDGAEDFTGNLHLAERARYLKHASAFIGLPSGLSWLAWAARAPVVMISGFSQPHSEFHTSYRITSPAACTGCWNDPEILPSGRGFYSCPRLGGTPREFECTKAISPESVIKAVDYALCS